MPEESIIDIVRHEAYQAVRDAALQARDTRVQKLLMDFALRILDRQYDEDILIEEYNDES